MPNRVDTLKKMVVEIRAKTADAIKNGNADLVEEIIEQWEAEAMKHATDADTMEAEIATLKDQVKASGGKPMDEELKALFLQKRAMGLSVDDALDVATRQLTHNKNQEKLKAEAAKKAAEKAKEPAKGK